MTDASNNRADSQSGFQAAITRRGFLGLLPAALAAATCMEQGPPSAECLFLRPVQPAFRRKNLVWAVDDDPAVGELYRLILDPAGFLTRVFRERTQALEALYRTDQPPALIIMDFVGHRIGADLFMRLCRMQHPQIKILMVTGCGWGCLEDCVAKPDRFLQKPFGLESLLTKVGGLLRSAR